MITDQITSAFDELRLGETSTALELLGSTWLGIGKRPKDAATHRETAENLLLCGMVTSKLGAERKVPGAQDAAKDLLHEANRLFARIRDPRKHKAQIELALSYWRAGEINEAVAFIAEVRPPEPQLNFEAKLTKALFETEVGKIDDALATLTSIEAAVDNMPHVLRGQFHQERAVALRKRPTRENLDRALIEYESALYYYEDANCVKGEAMIRNNLASIYRDFGDYRRAHNSAAKAIALFTRLNNQHLLAEALDQQASIFYAEENFAESARLSRLASNHLQRTDQKAMLGRALVTLGRSLARLGRNDEAREELERAGAIFEHTNDPIGQANVSLTLIEELPLPIPEAIELLASAARLSSETHLSERFNKAALKLSVQIMSNNSSSFADVDAHADEVRFKLTERVLAQHGGIDARGAAAHAAKDLGITHPGLLHFLSKHEAFGYKKKWRTSILTLQKHKKSA
jgi:tetratricopeptide (TPR) repeat protein